jgi:hypothetical protein
MEFDAISGFKIKNLLGRRGGNTVNVLGAKTIAPELGLGSNCIFGRRKLSMA